MADHDFSQLRALFFNCTLTRSPGVSNTQGLIDVSVNIMKKHNVEVEVIRAIDHDIATGIYPDMTEHGWESDEWPAIYETVKAANILVVAGPIWLGDNSSITKLIIERLYACSAELNDAGQYDYYGKVGGALITGNEDGVTSAVSYRRRPTPAGSAKSVRDRHTSIRDRAAPRTISPTGTRRS